ncbi:MAG: hypothetical protein ACR2KT_10530 [Methylocella sp.]
MFNIDQLFVARLETQIAEHEAALVQSGGDDFLACDDNTAGDFNSCALLELFEFVVVGRSGRENGQIRLQGVEIKLRRRMRRGSEI